jgi:hypothetical protein
MMYHAKLVACIKVNGQILRESGDSVSIPFGSEYSVLIKNLNSVRVMVRVSVDSTDATEGIWLVVPPNGQIELERFIRNGNMNSGNRFKFIKRTEKIEKHRGVQADDGLIRIEYKTEKVEPKPIHVPVVYDYHYDFWPYRPWPHYPWTTFTLCGTTAPADPYSGPVYNSSNSSGLGNDIKCQASFTSSGAQASGGVHLNNVSLHKSATKSAPTRSLGAMNRKVKSFAALEEDDAGITVAGSESHQQFSHAGWFPTHDQSEVLVLRLRGEVGGKKVVKAVTVKTKPTCPTCGKKNRATTRFCAECGTSLTLV